jgi:hypothetical protein
MWSEEMDKRIRAAAESSTAQYDEKQWADMETLLDKHLPVDKRRRRFIFIILATLVGLGLGAYFIFSSAPSTSKTHIIADKPAVQPFDKKKSTPESLSNSEQQKTTKIEPRVETSAEAVGVAPLPDNPATAAKPTSRLSDPVNKQSTSRGVVNVTAKGKNGSAKPNFQASATALAPGSNLNKPVKEPEAVSSPVTDQSKINPPSNNQSKVSESPVPAAENKNPEAIAKQPADSDKTDSIAKPAKKQAPRKSSKFAINLLMGPDISSVATNKPGRLTVGYGIGLSYSINKNWTVRTGLLAGQKIYSADSTSYKTYYTSGIYNSKLSKIEADCFVYEIPVSFVYHFNGTKKHNWFVSAGASSYLMKKEKYNYIYESQSGQLHTYARSYRNKNSHFFSVLSLSAGYRYQLNSKVSIMAEPYFKTPLGGVGQGKVKLNSTGIMLSAAIKPFK